MGDWWQQGNPPQVGFVTAAELATSAVETAKIKDQNVTSEKASANLLTRTLAVPIPDLAKATNLSSDYVLWQPLRTATLEAVGVVWQSSWVLSTAQADPVLDVFNNGSTTAQGSIHATDPPARGVFLDLGTLTNAAITSGTSLTARLSGMTSSNDAPAMTVLLHYKTTG